MRTSGWLGGILLFALLARLAWGIYLPADDTALARLPDQREYLELGRNLIGGNGLNFVDPRFADVVHAYRAPGYPLLVAACAGNVRAIRALQAVLDTSAVLATFLLARRWLDAGASLVAAGIVAVNPFLIYFAALVLSETLFVSMLVWGMAMITTPRQASARWWLGAVMLAASVLVRPSALLLPVCLAISAAIANRGAGPATRWAPPVGATMLLLIGTMLLPWAYRNYRVLGTWIWTTTNTGITMYDGFNPDARGGSDQRFVASMPQLRAMTEVQRSNYLQELARQYISQNRRHSVLLGLVKIARTWSPVPLSDEYGGNARYVAAAAAYMIPFGLLCFLGLFFGSPPTAAKVFLLLPAIYFTVAHAASVGSLRYRIPADVPMAVLAASMQFRKSAPGASPAEE